MEEERARILRMVAESKISPEDAADLLEALQPVRREERRPPNEHPGHMEHSPHGGVGGRRARALVIHIREGGENRVNVRIPLALTKVAGKFIPRQAATYLKQYDINLQEFLDEMGGGDSGTILEVKEGDNKVLIAVE